MLAILLLTNATDPAQQLNNMERYLGLVTALGKIQATLSDLDKDEFYMYRMILGPQKIVLPE